MEPYPHQQNPRLASILQNLAQFTQPAVHNQGQIPDHAVAAHSGALGHHSSASVQSNGSSFAPPTQDPRKRPATPQPDSSKITEWPAAVKYVMKTLSQNPEASSKVKRLIRNQHDNERQWWAGREALIAKHKSREENQKKANDLLRSFGTTNGQGARDSASTAEEEKAELERYDKKVYTALGQMVAAMDRELTALRVPFFAIRHDLIQAEGKDGVLNRVDLIELQKRILQLLQDSFGD